jgi:hypothetical protein
VARMGVAERPQGGHCGEEVAEAEGAQDQKTRCYGGHEPSVAGVTTSSRTSQPAG